MVNDKEYILFQKEKIKESLELLDELVKYTNNLPDNCTEAHPQALIKSIKEVLEG